MKRITNTLLVAAIPALGFSTSLFSTSAAPQTGLVQDGRQTGGQDGGNVDDDLALDGDVPPEGFDPNPSVALDVFGRRTRARSDTFADRIKGGWRLIRMAIPGSDPRGRLAQGFMHIGDSFMSLEIHALWEEGATEEIPENDFHTSFTAEYQVDSSGKMFCSTVLGAYIDEETGELRWEREGYEREFRVSESVEELKLTFNDPQTGRGEMVFVPYLPRTKGRTDIFGRNEVGSYGATDIYGRSKAAHRGERDIYGRPVEAPEEPETEEEVKAKRDLERRRRGLGLPPTGSSGSKGPFSGRGGR